MDLNIHPTLPRKKDFRIGVLGSGFIVNECHLVAYRKAGFNPVAIASRTRSRAEVVATRHGIPKVYDTPEQLLEDRSIEVLDIAVPPDAQLPLIRAACARRTVRGILAQKPLGVNYAEAVEAVQLCEAAGITLAANQNMRYDPSVRAAKTLLDRGVLGQPVFVTIDMRAIPHWMPWQRALGWVTLRIMSIHHLDCFRYWFGDPARIYCSVRPDPRTTFPHEDGIATYILEYESGLRCVGIDDTWTGPAKEGCPAEIGIHWRIEGLDGLALGEIGWCKEPFTSPSRIRYAAKGDERFQGPVWTESWFPDAFIGTMAQLLVAIETGTEPVISGRDNLKTMALVEAAYRSAEQRRAVEPQEIESGGWVEEAAEIVRWREEFLRQADVNLGPDDQMHDFTSHAQQLLLLARSEADRLRQNFVGTESLLLGLAKLNLGAAIRALRRLGVDLPALAREAESSIGVGPVPARLGGGIPYTPRIKKALAMAAREAVYLRSGAVGTEHVVLGLLREGNGVAAQVLNKAGVTLEKFRAAVVAEFVPEDPSEFH